MAESRGHMKITGESVEKTVVHQLKSHWLNVDEHAINDAVPKALDAVERNYLEMSNGRFWDGREVVFSPYFSLQWMNFLYRLSRELFLDDLIDSADQVYYLNKIMHGNDWLYVIDLPVHFHCEHPLGSVLGRAVYGDHLFVYQGTTIGGNRDRGGTLYYPVLGDNVTLFANATVLGDTKIGNNVIISADTYLINEEIPDNCLVFGKSPDIIIRQKTEEEIKEYTRHVWRW